MATVIHAQAIMLVQDIIQMLTPIKNKKSSPDEWPIEVRVCVSNIELALPSSFVYVYMFINPGFG